MISDQFSRTRALLGDSAVSHIINSKIAVFGIGGVGSYCAEALGRAGVGSLHLYDDDVVSESNLNRQIEALHSTIGQFKAQVMAQRILDINPSCQVVAIPLFYIPGSADKADLSQYDYVADCIDTVSGKLELISRCKSMGIPIISAMGTGNRMDPTALTITDISKTEGCPLARVMRKELRKRGIQHLKVVCSLEPPITPVCQIPRELLDHPSCNHTTVSSNCRRNIPGSGPFVPPVAGLIMASAIIKELTNS